MQKTASSGLPNLADTLSTSNKNCNSIFNKKDYFSSSIETRPPTTTTQPETLVKTKSNSSVSGKSQQIPPKSDSSDSKDYGKRGSKSKKPLKKQTKVPNNISKFNKDGSISFGEESDSKEGSNTNIGAPTANFIKKTNSYRKMEDE